jgi:hypothetical protein
MSNLMMQSRILLYGRVLQGITIDASVFDAGTGGYAGLGSNRFLREQFDTSTVGSHAPCFAMIYGFEFEAHYYDLMVPTVLLVHGTGETRVPANDPVISAASDRVEEPFPDIAPDIVVWPYDKADFSMRLDIDSGPLESILLEVEFDDLEMAAESSGRKVSGRKVSGRKVAGSLGRGRKVHGRKMSG